MKKAEAAFFQIHPVADVPAIPPLHEVRRAESYSQESKGDRRQVRYPTRYGQR